MPTRAKGKTSVVVAEDAAVELAVPTVVGPTGEGMSMDVRQTMLADGAATNIAQLRSVFGSQARSWDEIEPSFTVVNKAVFENQPMVIGAFRFNLSKKFGKVNKETGELVPSEYASVLCAKLDGDEIGEWVVFNDGSSGVREQLHRAAARYDNNPAFCPAFITRKGLKLSEYPYEEVDEDGQPTGKIGTARTWRIG